MSIKNSKIVFLVIVFMLLGACRTNPPSSQGQQGIPGPSSPTAGTPVPTSGGGLPPSGTGSPSTPGGSKNKPSTADGSASGESSDGEGVEDSAAIPPEWEDDEATSGEGASEEGVANSDEPSFEEAVFEEAEELSEAELEELEKELDESLGDFDETIRREQEYAEQNANENAEDAAYDSGEDSLAGVGTFESYTDADVSGGDGGEADDSVVETKTPDDIPDARDDDIVARQIREAALKEKDPVLREKLWEEYRKYKKQT